MGYIIAIKGIISILLISARVYTPPYRDTSERLPASWPSCSPLAGRSIYDQITNTGLANDRLLYEPRDRLSLGDLPGGSRTILQ